MSVLTDVKAALRSIDAIRFLDFNNISVQASDGQATLSGHVVKDKRYIKDIVGQVPGVTTDFPAPPQDWHPPYLYTAANVRWSADATADLRKG